ncbi:MAG TPA: helix-turn-helix domain-containing protein [Pseudonocardiaceae bacterium]|nr:helix-turn-helix domain-containing protein [Pseudonocardiaceae bacterium]
MVGKRSYGDPCGTARALDVIGERWALLVVRELLLGPKRFTDLSRGLPAMSQNVLAARLRELESSGVLRNYRLGPPASTRVYELTERGYALEAVLIALGRWGSRIPLDAVDAAAELSVDALVLALKTTFDAGRAGDLDTRIELRLEGDRFLATISGGTLRIGRVESGRVESAGGAATGMTAAADAVMETDPATLRSVVFGGRALADALRAGVVLLTGEQDAATRFTGCFPRPEPVV